MGRTTRWAVIVSPLVIMIIATAYVCQLIQISRLASHNPTTTSYLRHKTAVAPDTTVSFRWIALARVPAVAVCAVVKSEDREFFVHHGIQLDAVQRSVASWLKGGRMYGASTISQQTARNLYLAPTQSLRRKLAELFVTVALEHELSKARILELYLNIAEWGPGVWGIEAASQYYFEKGVANLSAFESVFLASLLPAPTHALSGKNLERAARVQRRVLQQLRISAIIDGSAYESAVLRQQAVESALRAGRDTRVTARVLGSERFSDGIGLTVNGVIETGCNIDRELFAHGSNERPSSDSRK